MHTVSAVTEFRAPAALAQKARPKPSVIGRCVAEPTGDSPDFSGDYPQLVEAAGQLVHLFRDGLDYAFIPHCSRSE